MRDRLEELQQMYLMDSSNAVADINRVPKNKKDLIGFMKCFRRSTKFNIEVFIEEFFKEVEFLKQTINLIFEYVENVKTLHSNILGNPVHDSEQTEKLDEITAEIENLTKTAVERLNTIVISIKNDDDNSKAKLKILSNHFKVLSMKFAAIMLDWNAAQIVYDERRKRRIRTQLDISARQLSNEELEEIIENGKPGTFAHGIITVELQAQQALKLLTEDDVQKKFSSLTNQENIEKLLTCRKVQLFCIQHMDFIDKILL